MELLIALALICGGVCAYIGSQKGRSGGKWFLAGCLLGVFGIVAVASVPALEKRVDDTKGMLRPPGIR